MSSKILLLASVMLAILLTVSWQAFAGDSYETAKYEVVSSEGSYEVRDYPELKIVVTSMASDAQSDSGSFMRLFRYISGENEEGKKIAMTTPVFMQPNADDEKGQMGFVLPAKVAEAGAPSPGKEDVSITVRPKGKFAVYQFSGRMDKALSKSAQSKLEDWMKEQGLTGTGQPEFAGYDPPWIPEPMRRNEVLIRLK